MVRLRKRERKEVFKERINETSVEKRRTCDVQENIKLTPKKPKFLA